MTGCGKGTAASTFCMSQPLSVGSSVYLTLEGPSNPPPAAYTSINSPKTTSSLFKPEFRFEPFPT